MSDFTVTKTQIMAGVWEGVVDFVGTGVSRSPRLACVQSGQALDGLSYTADDQIDGRWKLRIAIPPQMLRDGVQIFQIIDTETQDTLSHFTLLTDEVFDDGIRDEVHLLRAEVELLKRAIRRLSLED